MSEPGAADDHPRAADDHPRAADDHPRAADDHPRPAGDHPRPGGHGGTEGDGKRAGGDWLRRAGSMAVRVGRAWRALPHERRLAAGAAIGIFLTLFLPWYQETVIAGGTTPKLRSASASLTGWGAFSFVEAAVLLVAAGVLVLLFIRAEGNAFHVPGGDGGVIMAAGLWAAALIVWRIFDKQGTTGHGQYATTAGIEWGIFIALGVALLLAYAGTRIKRAHEPEPPLPGEPPPAAAERAPEPRRATQIRPPRQRVARDRQPSRGLNFSDLDAIKFDDPPEVPTVRGPHDEPSQGPAVPRLPEPDEQLTIRLDRTD